MIRYYMGKIKLERLTKKSSRGTALYRILENGSYNRKSKPKGTRIFKKGELIIAPCRICRKKRKNK